MDLTTINKSKYLKAPEWEQIDEFIKELGIPNFQFERFYQIPYNTIAQVKNGTRKLPAKFWNVIFEKIKPAYGSGFLEDSYKMSPSSTITKPITREVCKKSDNKHGRLNLLPK